MDDPLVILLAIDVLDDMNKKLVKYKLTNNHNQVC